MYDTYPMVVSSPLIENSVERQKIERRLVSADCQVTGSQAQSDGSS